MPADLDEYFHQEWIRTLLTMAVDDLRAEYEGAGKRRQFEVFQRYDLDGPASGAPTTYGALARELGVSATDVTNYLSAARKAFRRLLLDRLRAICGDGGEFEAEARHLLRGGLR